MRPGGNVSKGKEGERQVCKLLQPVVNEVHTQLNPQYAAPVLTRNLNQARDAGYDLNGLEGLCIEVKWQKNLLLRNWWQQAVEQADAAGGEPVLVYKTNHQPWRVRMYVHPGNGVWLPGVLEMEDFLVWLRTYLRNRLLASSE